MDRGRGTALDVGAGSLNSSRHLLAAGYTVHAVDPDPYTVELAAALADPRLTVHGADIQETPIAEGEFDLVVALHVLHLLPRSDVHALIPRLVRGLRAGGMLCATFVGVRDSWARTPWRATAFRQEEVLELLSDLDVLLLDELEYNGANVLGQPKHWHTLRFLCRSEEVAG